MPTPAVFRSAAVPRNPTALPWVQVAPVGRYFMTDDGAPFLLIGQNDAVNWPNMWQLHYEADIGSTERYIQKLAAHGVTVMRMMLEYCHDDAWYLEKPVGRFAPEQVLYWDNVIGLCERHGVRLLLSPWDTFFMARRWEQHPYSAKGSPFRGPSDFCVHRPAIAAEKARLAFIIDRWGDSPAILGFDLLNEIHPHWGGTVAQQGEWIHEIATFMNARALARHGRRHLLTCSIFGPMPEGEYPELIFRHPDLDFATTHIYWPDWIDMPENTFDCVRAINRSVRYALGEIRDQRPFTDTETGPIHLFLERQQQLDAAFDTEYYHNMSWAHLMSGGAGSGMRWPSRNPHCLTDAMHAVQAGMARACRAVDWAHFAATPVEGRLRVVAREVAEQYRGTVPRLAVLPLLPARAYGVSDGPTSFLWVLRDSRVVGAQAPLGEVALVGAGWLPGSYTVEFFDTYTGAARGGTALWVGEPPQDTSLGTVLRIPLPLDGADVGLVVRRSG